MEKVLLIVESPNKCSKIKSFLPDNYTVIASNGHLNKIKNCSFMNMGIELNRGFKILYELIPGKINILQNILDNVETHDTILLFGDDDREGQAINFHTYERIKGYDNKKIKIIKSDKIEKAAILKAISEATDIDMNVVYSQMARSAIDKICGYMVSPYLAKTTGIKNISAGRVQSIIVKLIRERENEIINFKPEDYWTFQIPLSFNSIDFTAKYESRITSQKQADDLLSYLTDKNTIFTTTKSVGKLEKFNPQPPFDTNNMISYMGKRYKFEPDKTLSIAQTLFESGMISYHRSDSISSSPEELKNLIEYIKTQNLPLPPKPYIYKNKQENSQQAHTAIHPLDLSATKVFGGSDANLLYSVIRQQFICSQLKYAQYNTLKVSIDAVNGKKKETLVCSGKSLKDPGFLTFLNVQDKSQINIPDLKKGDICLLQSNPIVEKKHTNPKSRFSISTLISTLKEMEVGRPSTVSGILKKVLDKKYIELRDGIYHPMEIGINIVNEIDNKFDFMDYEYTADIEKKLDLIASGEKTYFDTVNNFYNKFKSQLDALYKIKGFDICKKCGGVIVERLSKDGKEFKGCSNYPLCKNII
jgi:DNA topoisomerase-1